jgi:hypothetical protein
VTEHLVDTPAVAAAHQPRGHLLDRVERGDGRFTAAFELTAVPVANLRDAAAGHLTIDGATFRYVRTGASDRFSDALVQLTATP